MAGPGTVTTIGKTVEEPAALTDIREQIQRAQVVTPKRGRTSSIPSDNVGGLVRNLFQSYAGLSYFLPWEIFDYVEILSTYNPDYSQAVDNIRTLANSGHNLYVDAGSDLAQRRIKGRLEEKARQIQEPHGGIDGVVDKLLDQAATYGAMCGEWVLSEDLTDVIDFVDLNPKVIRFFYEEDHWAPYQKLSNSQMSEIRKQGREGEVKNGCLRLNEMTFRYYAFDAAPGSPYGTPPFLAALANIAIQRDMTYNLAQIVKKIGLLGLVSISVKMLPVKPGESAEDYQVRAGAYLETYADGLESFIKDGGMAHYDEAEVNTEQLAGNAAGATAIYKQNEEMIFSGLKSMPSVQGRSYSTTETYAGVAYDIIIRNTFKYQRAVKRMIEAGYWLMMDVWGERPTAIRLEFNSNKSVHRLQDAQAEEKEITNAWYLWWLGVIDQVGVSQRLGHDGPKRPLDEPPIPPKVKGEETSSGSSNEADAQSKEDEDDEEDDET